MPFNAEVMGRVWDRWQYARNNGHIDFIGKADLCESFFRGEHWRVEDKQELDEAKRPTLTVNKILPTISTVAGEQIYNRNEISFRPLNGSSEETAEALRRTYKQISNNNQLDWRRSDMFLDGVITSRGFLDVRMDFADNMKGEVRVTNLNPKNVIPDPDADDYDPDTWNEVMTTKWLSVDDIAVLYSGADAELLKSKDSVLGTDWRTSFSDEDLRDRIGSSGFTASSGVGGNSRDSTILRNLRLVERQHKVISSREWFIDTTTGNMRPIPEGWDKNRIAFVANHFRFQIIKRQSKRIRWTAGVGNVVLHDDWSPYDCFTVIPYFPYFRYGKTIGLVENLIGSQELLNKVTSQELHVVNSAANSGWKVKTGSLTNMSIEELEQQGAKTGLVIEMNGDLGDIEKITPNATPTGLDRISYKAEEHIKSISNVGDSQQGQDRADVAAKAIQQKRQAAGTSQAKTLDSLQRTDFFLARTILKLIQTFMSEEQIISITHGGSIGENEDMTVNQMTPEGNIANDLTLGEYAVVMTSVPQRETLEDSQFDQGVALRELGISIPDEVLVDTSRLMNKKDILKKMAAASNSPEAQAATKLQTALQEAELAKLQSETTQKDADAGLKRAKTQSEGVKAQKSAEEPVVDPEANEQTEAEMVKVQAEIALNRDKFEFDKALALEKMQLERDKLKNDQERERKDQAAKMIADRIATTKSSI